MTSREIRQKFLQFFENKGHKIVPSAPMVVKNDPTLMFTNAGMNQFKDYFLENKEPQYTRVADTQKCLRVSGKHNDLEEVGIDTYHHTMFEMLGNWSFGDYFKKEAIAWAWELLTEGYGLPKEDLYATVFGGDEADGLGKDEEAFGYWKEILPEERILFAGKKDNFWEMGDVGPCGPCSEIHIDLRPEAEKKAKPGRDLVNQDHPQVIEIWNLVFMQYNRMSDSSLKSLPAKHVDTGMGFERLCMAIQGKTSNYDTDVFTPLLDKIGALSGKRYDQDRPTEIAFRVAADHIRAITLSIADGQLPSNNKAGYVIRRILRRAVRYGYTFLGLQEPFLYKLVPVLADQFSDTFPEVKAQLDLIQNVVKEEEAAFLRTLENGLKKMEVIKEELDKKGEKVIPGARAFELYDTYGFPLDLTALIARENDLSVDEKGFEVAMKEQKERSKSASKMETGDWQVLRNVQEVRFLGYDQTQADAQIVRYRTVKGKKKDQVQVVLDQTPFYAESGGQVGDKGYLQLGEERIKVLDTVKENDLIIHLVDKLPADPEAEVFAQVDVARREKIRNNHSATHLLHAALRKVLGDHVQQKGSLVNDKLLRFDFSHFSKMTKEELQEVEQIVNRKIRENVSKDEKRQVPIAEAKALGAMALFGEKYGDEVRVITFDPEYSIELCGGTHVPATGNIGLFKIISESSVAAGVRRIEAITGEEAERFVDQQLEQMHQLEDLLKHPKDLTKSIEDLLKEKSKLDKALEKLQQEQTNKVKAGLLEGAEQKAPARVIIEKITLPHADALKKLSFELKNEVPNIFAVLAADIDGKPQLSIVIGDDLLKEKDWNAGQLIREWAKLIQGGGGGQPFFATAGGKNLQGLPDVVETAKKFVEENL